MVQCESAVGCNNPAALSVSLLVPTGEVIESDTGPAPVLRPVSSKRLCSLCAFGAGVGSALITALGAHLDVEALDEPEQRLPNDLCAMPAPPPYQCGHRRDRHLDQSGDPLARKAGGAHPCLDCLSCKGFVEPDVPESADPITAAKAVADVEANARLSASDVAWTAADAARLHAAQEGE